MMDTTIDTLSIPLHKNGRDKIRENGKDSQFEVALQQLVDGGKNQHAHVQRPGGAVKEKSIRTSIFVRFPFDSLPFEYRTQQIHHHRVVFHPRRSSKRRQQVLRSVDEEISQKFTGNSTSLTSFGS
jgi:hypothetical protein